MTDQVRAEPWVSGSKRDNEQLFSELDVLLRALDRFFTLESFVPISDDLSTKNFYDELITVRDAILRILGILEVVIPESQKNIYWFQKFAESKLMNPHARDIFRESMYRQETPEKGLFLLYDSCNNLKGVITDLSRSGTISYMGFKNIGHMIGKEIRENRFFNPFLRNINPEYDFIRNQQISDIVKAIPQKEVRKYVSVIYILLFRILRFLNFIDVATQRSVSLNSSLMILLMMQYELGMFLMDVEKSVKKIRDPEIQMLLKAVAYQFSMESRRVFLQELRDIHRRKATPQFRGKLENSHGILKNLTEHSIIQIAQYFRPEIKGEDVFESFVTKLQQSIRLREDIYALHKFLSLLESSMGNLKERVKVFNSVRNYMNYFESFTFRLLRYDDYEEFVQFFNRMYAVKKELLLSSDFSQVMEKVMHFKIYLETTLRHIGNRAELGDKPIDMVRIDALIQQYL